MFNLGRSSVTFLLNPYYRPLLRLGTARALSRVLKLVKNTGSSSGRDSYNET